jgi:hypothetical protein
MAMCRLVAGRIFPVGFVAVITLLAACRGDGEGDSCKITSDCLAGLVCDNPAGPTGVCRKPGDVPVRPDAAPPDAPVRDAAGDLAADRPLDSPARDAGTERPTSDAAIDGDAVPGDGDDAQDGGVPRDEGGPSEPASEAGVDSPAADGAAGG